ncbi:MAG TPA: hypothetical protein PLV92_09025 [Pirellulaceae bacterium]|nr:hypothetical protein [Pirellulaceae bacterium]
MRRKVAVSSLATDTTMVNLCVRVCAYESWNRVSTSLGCDGAASVFLVGPN